LKLWSAAAWLPHSTAAARPFSLVAMLFHRSLSVVRDLRD